MKINKTFIPKEIIEKTKLKILRAVDEDENGCWILRKYKQLWPNGKQSYGKLSLSYKTKKYNIYAHRASYYLFIGEIPKDTLVLHKCPGGGNGLCVNPDHLSLGGHKENMKDCQIHGRENKSHGSNHHKSKIKEEDIRKIFVLDFMGFSQTQIGKLYDVPHTAIGNILRNKSWKHVK